MNTLRSGVLCGVTAESAMNLLLINEHEKSNELVRTKTNSCGVSSFEFVANFFSYQDAKVAKIS